VPFPAISVLDDFARANEDPLSGGGNWSGPWREAGDQMRLVGSGFIFGQTTGATKSSYWAAQQFGPNVAVASVIASPAAAAINLGCRITSPGASWSGYILGVSNGSWTLYYRDGSNFHQIGTGTQTIATNDSIGLYANGTTIEAYWQAGAGAWTNIISVTDSNISGSGYIGVNRDDSTSASSIFSGGTITGGGGAVSAAGGGYALTGASLTTVSQAVRFALKHRV
jgi:hypothetical protein